MTDQQKKERFELQRQFESFYEAKQLARKIKEIAYYARTKTRS